MSVKVINKGVEIEVDNMALVPVNERSVMTGLGPQLRKMMVSRILRGQDSRDKTTKKPKDGGRPFFRTGTLAGSITEIIRPYKARKSVKFEGGRVAVESQRWELVVLPAGQRMEGLKTRQRALKRRIQGRKFGVIMAAAFSESPPSRATLRKQLSKITSKTGTTNARVAGILSMPPADKNSRAGQRGIYRMVEMSNRESNLASNYVRQNIIMDLVAVDVRGAK